MYLQKRRCGAMLQCNSNHLNSYLHKIHSQNVVTNEIRSPYIIPIENYACLALPETLGLPKGRNNHMTRLIISLLREINPCSEEVDISANSKCLLALRYPVTLLSRGLRLWGCDQSITSSCDVVRNLNTTVPMSVCRTFMPSQWRVPFGPVPAHCRLSTRVGGSFYIGVYCLASREPNWCPSEWSPYFCCSDCLTLSRWGYWPATNSDTILSVWYVTLKYEQVNEYISFRRQLLTCVKRTEWGNRMWKPNSRKYP